MHNNILKKLSWSMVFILFITWSGIPQNAAYAQKTARLKEEERKRAVEKLEKLFDALEEAAKEIPRDTFDPQAIVDKVGKNPIKLFEWVRDNTYLVAYRGSLRGPIGVLMDRLGNSLDRALLLHELLTVAGHKARLVNGTLTKAQAEMVLKKAWPIPPEGALATEKISPGTLENLIVKYGEKSVGDTAELKRLAQNVLIDQQHIIEDVAQRVEEQTNVILDLLGEIPDIRKAEWAKAIKKVQDHWWVQWKTESKWSNMDPSYANAKPGLLLTKPERNYQPDNLNEDIFNLVTIRVLIERLEEGDLKKPETVLEHTLQPSKLFGKQILLQYIPLNWPENLDRCAEIEPSECLKAAVLKVNEWLPVLSVGSELIYQYSFNLSGIINHSPGQEKASKKGDTIRRAFGMFGSNEAKPKNESLLTAGWLEYEIIVPKEPKHKIRRQVFDFMSDTLRLKGNNLKKSEVDDKNIYEVGIALLFRQNQILTLNCAPSQEFGIYLVLKHLLDNKEYFSTILRQPTPSKAVEWLSKKQHKIIPFPLKLYEVAMTRMGGSSRWQNTYLSKPNIISHSVVFRPDLKEKNLMITECFDLVYNEVEIYQNVLFNPFKIRVEQGVRDAILETIVLSKAAQTLSTAKLFDKSIVADENWSLIQLERDIVSQKVKIPDYSGIQIRNELAKGYWIIVPKEPITVNDNEVIGWWRIKPQGGDTFAVFEGGGQATVGRVVLTFFGVVGLIWSTMCLIKGKNTDECDPCILLFVAAATFAVLFGLWEFAQSSAGALLSYLWGLSILYEGGLVAYSFIKCFIEPLF